MAKLFILLAAVVVLISSAASQRDEKPGQCPRSKVTFCIPRPNMCFGDSTCPGSQKCCTQGCSAVCLDPVSASPVPSTRPKPGQCPTPKLPTQGDFACGPQCSSDSECPGTKKCCTNNCGGTACISPLRRNGK